MKVIIIAGLLALSTLAAQAKREKINWAPCSKEIAKSCTGAGIGGIISATLLILVVLPVVFCRFESKMNGRVAH